MLLTFLAFVGAATLIVLLPGPDTLVVVRSILKGGRRQGTLTALGNLCGLSVWVAAAAFGLAAMLEASEVGYAVLRIVGACYLVLLGVQAWRSRGRVAQPESARRGILGTGFRAGVLTNLLNPKVGVFFVTFLPGFVPQGASVLWTTLLFGGIFILLTALYWVLLLGLAGRVTAWMNTPAIRRRLDAATAAVLVGFGLRLATE
ncbi:LysE family translocator [Nocardioides pocheonensis]|uniref:LysE family translocator n=1 Tax=Nocardioides pocheonensis TaxID=661485 RepID=A0A3N0GQ22_9ACTN|nr:LysE family translocator [Nocardioides pocheonensis]RNM14210.1 LysE family translocator [Nocardioides pocheonensis]